MKKLNSILKKVAKIVLVAIIVVVGIVFVFRLINAHKYKITTPYGIQESDYVTINGCELYVQIRGENKDNPVIVFVHGGPGFPLTYLSAYHQSYLESDYTFVNYGQRNSGRTFYKNKNNIQTPSVDEMLNDLHGIVEFTKKKLVKEKVVIMGQSWGSILGTLYSQKHPENVSAYIGVGQVTDFDEGKLFAAKKALEVAKKRHEDNAVKNITSAINRFEKAQNIQEVDLDNLNSLILNTMHYLKSDGEMDQFKQMFTGITSPYMKYDDIRWFLKASNTHSIVQSQKPLVNYMYYAFDVYDYDLEYSVPMYYIQGEADYITPTEMVDEYYGKIIAPHKKIIKIKNAGHTPFLDNPAQFATAVHSVLKR